MQAYSRVLVAWLLFSAVACAAESRKLTCFLTAKGDQLFEGEEPFRFISFNVPNLHLIEDNFSFTNPNPWRWPNAFEISDALESIRQMGGKVTRMYVLSVKREGADMGDHVFVRGPGDFNETAFRSLDKVLEIANAKGVRVIIPLVDNWHWWGGRSEYAKFREKSPDDFWSDEEILSDFEATIRYTLNRKNHYTGVAYKDDPAIFGWETGNELDSPPKWTRRISAFIKSQDANHLVIDGYALHGVRQESIDDPNIDVITTHHYPNTDVDYVEAITQAHGMTVGKKPYFVGEFGFIPTAELERVMDTIIERGISGGLLWSLRTHHREGGFYWHSEPAGENLFKAYHWPGFATGEAYDERNVLQLVRKKAFEIDGRAAPALARPAAPTLLPIEAVSAIAWQGSAGADRYEIQRAESRAGPWQSVGKDVSDAATQYRPQFADDDAKIGKSYFYRVRAIHETGVSSHSNVVGPVSVASHALVDECRDFASLSQHSGNLVIVSQQARKTQEDVHRFQLLPGSSVTYEVRGPIDSFTIYAFAGDQETDLRIECSADAKTFVECSSQRQVTSVATGDYGYLIPVMLSSSSIPAGSKLLRIAAPKNDSDHQHPATEISRVEIRFGAAEGPPADRSAGPRHGARLSPSILLLHKPYQTTGVPSVRRAADLKSQSVHVVATMLCEIDKHRQVISYGMLNRRRFVRLNPQLVAEFEAALRETFAEAVAHDMDIAVVAHLNSWGSVTDWRNFFQFDPLTHYGQYDYQQAVIAPIVRALVAADVPLDRVKFSLAGEMGYSVFSHAASYRRLLRDLRGSVRAAAIELGVSFNFNRVSGEYQATPLQQRHVQKLIEACDFIGFSNYHWLELPADVADFSHAVEEFLKEMGAHGVSIPADIPLHFSEIGIGGCAENNRPADSPAVAAKTPWKGSDNPSRNPWTEPTMRKFRQEYHRALLDFLAQQPASHRVAEAFLWSEGSWDPMGIESAGFADDQIITMIQQHNAAVADQASQAGDFSASPEHADR